MSPAYRAHPEFGYFCPSRGFRRKLSAAVAVIALAAVACAVVVGGSRDSRDDVSPPPAAVNATSSSAATASTVDQATAPAARPGPTEGRRPVCEGETWTYLDGKCIADKAQKPRIAAVDGPPIAAIPLGRTAPPPASPAAKAERPGEAAAALPAPKPERVVEADAALPSKSQHAADAAATTPAAAEPAVQSTSASKERRKASRDRASRDERRSARTASSDNRKPRSTTGWTKQVRSAEQFMRVFFSSGI
jgi:hypothetical protein